MEKVKVTYIGGPTLLIEVAGLRLLTDPTFDEPRTYQQGTFTHAKLAGPAIAPQDLGPIDAVLLSHDHHFDNLDVSGREFLKLSKHVLTTREGALRLGANSIGLDPFETFNLTSSDGSVIGVTATPARHGPARKDRGPVVLRARYEPYLHC